MYALISARGRPDPLPLLGSGVTKDREKGIETSRRKASLVFVRTPSLGSEPSFYDRAFGLLVSPTFLEHLRIAGV